MRALFRLGRLHSGWTVSHFTEMASVHNLTALCASCSAYLRNDEFLHGQSVARIGAVWGRHRTWSTTSFTAA